MSFEFESKKKKNSSTKRLSILPRIGIYVDFFGREFTFKQVPTIETAYNVLMSGVTLSNLKKITKRQFSEISFTKVKELKTVNTTAKKVRNKKLT